MTAVHISSIMQGVLYLPSLAVLLTTAPNAPPGPASYRYNGAGKDISVVTALFQFYMPFHYPYPQEP